MEKRAPLLSVETALTLVAGLVVGLIPDMDWWLRALGVLGTAVLAVHTAKRMDGSAIKRIAFPLVTIAILVLGTWRSVWTGFHQDFPAVTGQIALAKIVEACALIASGIAGYMFLLRPSAKRGYRVLPAQVIAFGFCVIVFGVITVGIGLAWQFQQNFANGTGPGGAPVPTFTVGPPQITQAPATPALPAPQQQQPFFFGYNFTEAGVTALASELYKIRDALPGGIELDRMGTDQSASGLVSNIIRACDQAGIDCRNGNVHPNFPGEKGIMIYVADPDKPPDTAKALQDTLRALGLDVPFVARKGFGAPTFSLFIGPAP